MIGNYLDFEGVLYPSPMGTGSVSQNSIQLALTRGNQGYLSECIFTMKDIEHKPLNSGE